MTQTEKLGLFLMLASSTGITISVQGSIGIGAAIFLVIFAGGAILFAEKKEK